MIPSVPCCLFVLVLFAGLASGQGQDLRFDSADAHLEVPASPELNPAFGLTIEAWVRYTPTVSWGSQSPTIVRKSQSGVTPYFLRVEAATRKLHFGVTTQTTVGFVDLYSSNLVAQFGWTHVAATWTGTLLSTYINGNLSSVIPQFGTLLQDSDPLQIGGGDGSAGETWRGRLDEVRIWSYARSATEIQATMNVQLDHAIGLVAAWHFNGDFLDETGGHDATPFGSLLLPSSTSPVDPLQLVAPGRVLPGASIDFLARGMPPGAPYFLDNSFAGSANGTPLVAPLVGSFPLDSPLLNLTFGPGAPGIFVDYLGLADAAGQAPAVFHTPSWPMLLGLEMASAFLYLDNLQPMTLGGISPVVTTLFAAPDPLLYSVFPATGPNSGGWPVTLQGANFPPGATVSFDGQPATGVVVHSSEVLSCLTPPAATIGFVDVEVADPSGPPGGLKAYLPQGFRYIQTMTISGLAPSYGLPGDQITISGSLIQPGTQVMVEGIPAAILLQNQTTIVFVVPQGVGCHAVVQVQAPDGQNANLLLNPGMAVTAAVGAQGPTAGGTHFHLVGGPFAAGATATVGGQAATISWVMPSIVEIIAPPGATGSAVVQIVNPDGCSALSSFLYQ